jgi:hypothetical protein
MDIKKLKDKITIPLLILLFIAGAFEIITYFYYIYTPASKIFGRAPSYRLEIPALSQLLKQDQATTESVSLADINHELHTEVLNSFSGEIGRKISEQNTFVKNSTMDFVITGDITGIEKSDNGSITVDLTNSTGAAATEVFGEEELKDIKVSLIIASLTDPSKSDAKLDHAQAGDYLIMRTFTNLLDKDGRVVKEIEIFRTPAN